MDSDIGFIRYHWPRGCRSFRGPSQGSDNLGICQLSGGDPLSTEQQRINMSALFGQWGGFWPLEGADLSFSAMKWKAFLAKGCFTAQPNRTFFIVLISITFTKQPVSIVIQTKLHRKKLNDYGEMKNHTAYPDSGLILNNANLTKTIFINKYLPILVKVI